ncbi:hypothetical protein SAY86_003889 [Trapa natans]|uniref:Uncharacterized protein n=1 Tax=Trapa natans TaxID=22666 RepID=A0AAN7MEZ0_TRANT|nr:hypothetical protein SAY86_003889 [Trapa natans]
MAAPASRLLLNNGKASLRLGLGSSLSRSILGLVKDHELQPTAQLLGRLHFQERPRVDPEVIWGTQASISTLRPGTSMPIFYSQTARCESRGRHGAEQSDEDDDDFEGSSDEEFPDDIEDFDSDNYGDYGDEDEEPMQESDEEDEKPRKRK